MVVGELVWRGRTITEGAASAVPDPNQAAVRPWRQVSRMADISPS
jgi:hypothetical protein